MAIRGAPGTQQRILGHLAKGDRILVLEITRPAGEEIPWCRVRLPASVPVWVSARLVVPDGQQGAVRGRDVQLRPLPGTGEQSLGEIGEPARVRILERVSGAEGEWLRIEPPPEARAYVRSDLLEFLETEAEAARRREEQGRMRAREEDLRRRFTEVAARIRTEEGNPPTRQSWEALEASLRGLSEDAAGTALEEPIGRERERVGRLAATVKALREAQDAERRQLVAEYEAKIRAMGPNASRVGWVYRLERPLRGGTVAYALEMGGACVCLLAGREEELRSAEGTLVRIEGNVVDEPARVPLLGVRRVGALWGAAAGEHD